MFQSPFISSKILRIMSRTLNYQANIVYVCLTYVTRERIWIIYVFEGDNSETEKTGASNRPSLRHRTIIGEISLIRVPPESARVFSCSKRQISKIGYTQIANCGLPNKPRGSLLELECQHCTVHGNDSRVQPLFSRARLADFVWLKTCLRGYP